MNNERMTHVTHFYQKGTYFLHQSCICTALGSTTHRGTRPAPTTTLSLYCVSTLTYSSRKKSSIK